MKPGAPVLLSLAIVESGGVATTITPDTAACSGTPKSQDACKPADGDSLCKLADDAWCRCGADMDDPTKGTWNCDPFSPMSIVIATFDRLLDTDPLDPGDASTTRDDIASISATPKPAVDIATATDYQSNGSPNGALFNLLGPYFFGNYRSYGPNLQVMSTPALPAGSSVEIQLDATKVLAKDGKTPFTGEGLLADGSIKFQTAPFSADLTIPMAPPPPPADGGEDDGGADGGAPDAPASEGGTDGAVAEGGADAGTTEGGASEGGATLDGGLDVSIDAPKVDAAVAEVAGSDAAATEVAGNDAAAAEVAPPAPPAPGEPVPADMSMTPVVLTFNNVIDFDDVVKHIKVTEDGQPYAAKISLDDMAPNKVNIAPIDAWAAGKTYVVTVDANVTDKVGDKLGGMGLAASFTMAK